MIVLVVGGAVFDPHPRPVSVAPAIHALQRSARWCSHLLSRAGETATRAVHIRENWVQFPGPQPAFYPQTGRAVTRPVSPIKIGERESRVQLLGLRFSSYVGQ